MPAIAQVGDDLLDVGHRDRVDAGERLVEQDELRRDHQRARDLDAAALAARQRVGRRVGQRRQVQLVQQRPQPRPPLGRLQVERLEDRVDVLLDGQPAEHRRLLREVADALARPDGTSGRW